MQRLVQLIIANPLAVVLLVAMVVWAGAFALLHLPVGLFPGLDVPVVNVITHYPGAASQDMESLITRPIEDRLRTIPAVRRVSSTSIEGISLVTAEFEWGTRLADARQLVQTQVSALEGALPAGIIPRIENIGTTLQEVSGYVVYGGASLIDLRTTVQTDLATRLMSVEGVAWIDVLGGDEPAFLVQLRSEALLREHLTVGAVTAALARFNVAVAADFIERGSREYSIRGDNRLQTLEQVEAVPVVNDGTRVVLLRDIATVQAGRVPRH
jgi:multidrug efflux pump subunit AcrB